MSADPDRPSSPLRWVEHIGEVVDSIGQPQHRSGVERAGAGGHDEAVERGEAHRGGDAAAVEGGAERVAATEVGDDDPPCLGGELGHPGDRPGVREAVEAVDADVAPQLGRQRVGARTGRDRGVEGRVEAGDLREVGPRRPAACDRLERRRLVQRGQLGQARAARPRTASSSDGRRGPVATVHRRGGRPRPARARRPPPRRSIRSGRPPRRRR